MTILRGAALCLWLLSVTAVAQDTNRDDTAGYQDREILLTVFQGTSGFAWTDSTNWIQQGKDVCEWTGITCYPEDTGDARRAGRIQALNLKNNHLVGTMPSVVFELPYLETLDIEDNADVTVDFTSLSKAQFLKEMDLSNTQVDNIASIGDAVNLEVLHLTGLKLTGSLPSSLFTLTNLEHLFANGNSFSGPLSGDIAKLTALREIYLGNSDMTGQLPDVLGSLSLLEVLTLTNNAFSGSLPQTAMNALTNLKTLAIQRDDDLPKGSGISGSVPAFAKHPGLTGLYLQNQRLSGSLDGDFLMDCPEGEKVEVDLSSNQISGSVPETLKDKKYLSLYLADNQITLVPSGLVNTNSNTCADIGDWMDGDVFSSGCNSFLCPPGTWAPEGRSTNTDSCATCGDDSTLWGRNKCDSSTTPEVQDRQVLVNLYNVMGGRDWKNGNNWLSLDTDVCEWYGITCTDGLVSAINLRNNGLSGTPPQELFSLSQLRSLNLELNKISFSFKGISAATNLQELNLGNTDLPASALDALEELTSPSNLGVLSMESNDLGGTIPAAVFSMTSLQELNLGHNGFTGTLDTRIGLLTQLQRLFLDGNELNGQFPTQIGNCVGLQDLSAGENQFGGTLPTQLNQLTNLQSLALQQIVTAGGIGGPMLSFANLGQMSSLKLASNQLTGSLPTDFLSNSRILGSAISVDLSDNGLVGSIPAQWSRFDQLTVDLTGNRISGIDSSLCQLTDWMGGDVGSFGCDGILCPKGTSNTAGRKGDASSECTNCSNGGTNFLGAKSCSSQQGPAFGTDTSETGILSDFFAATHGSGWTQNNGWIDSSNPCSFFGVECDGAGRVLKIDLSDNGLQGTAPGSIFKLPELNELILSKNSISIEFEGIADATALVTLKLDDNNLDSITGLGNAPNLASVYLADNNLQGEIPYEVYLLSNLRELDLGYNQLSGKIPNLVGALTSLEVLRLYHNKFTGRIPAALGDLTNLQELNLAENNFEGTIPQEMNELTNLRFLSLQREGGILGTNDIGIDHGDSSALGAGLTGPLPAFDKLPFLSELYLGVNSLTGSIPFNFLDGVTDTSVEVKVDLTSNQITGTIPGSLTQFDTMSLFAAGNRITEIPSSLCSKATWLGGDVTSFQCDGILCPAGTYNALGRKSASTTTCQTCSTGTSGYLGSFECLSSVEHQENAERAILEKIYRKMNGENWLDRTNWMDSDESICTWFGIECVSADNPSVVSIDLENNRLLNSLVGDVFNLPNLQRLNLKRNDIQVSLFGIQNAASLEYLDLSETGLVNLSGVLGALGLKVLRADGNNMTAFPEEVYNLVNLETLSLSDNAFPQMVVPDLQGIPNLTHLSLSNCGLMGIVPAWVGGLSNLEYLKLSQNALMGNLPTALLQLTNLKLLDLSDQDSNGGGLGGNLLDFANQTELIEVYLQYNQFQGPIPTTLLQRNSNTELVTLDLRYNQLTGTVPSALSRINEMNIYLAHNNLNFLPDEICNTNWNDGNTGTHGCDGILCGTGTYNAYGRAIGTLECMTCDYPFMTSMLGSTSCGASMEHTALITFYQSTGGPSWTSDTNWLKSEDHCTWEGITCHVDGEFKGFVQKIDLEDNNLVGNADLVLIWLFQGLEILNLQKNDVMVPFLNIENAISLQTLLISETKTNSLAGVGGAQQLKELHVTNSELFGQIPTDLFDLTRLEKLYLSQNALTGSLQTMVGQLRALKDLYVFDNNMRGTLPSEIGLLDNLEHLSLGQNQFVGTVPRQLGSLPRLEVLSIEKEEDAGFDGMFGVSGGGLSGSLPALNGLPNIKELYLGHNSFTGTIPAEFLQGVLNKDQLMTVDLSYNNLVGPMPSEFSNFGNLQIELGRNQISEIPAEVCAKTSWFNGEVANGCDAILCFPGTYNEFGRRIDAKTICQPCTYPGSAVDYGAVECGPVFADSMTDQAILMELYDAAGGFEWSNSASWNSDSGSFCEWYGITCEPVGEFGQMAVTEIALPENNLKGIIPSILFHLPELRKLDVRDNSVSIGLGALFQAENLEELYLDKTRVTSLEGIGRASSLRTVHLHNNAFGWMPIPDELFDLIELEDLNLSDSMFGGTLSTKIGQLSKLKRLSLVGNAISGQIPSEVGNLVAVQELDLSNNDWHGTLPDTVSGLVSLVSLGLTNDQGDRVGVTGQLRPFDTMPGLRGLYLSNNQFTGSIPDSFLGGASTSSLITVYLDGNNLGGTIPAALASFDQMNIYLENNLFIGFGDGICQKTQWMEGNVGRYGCDAILCPAGEYSAAGRQISDSTACEACPDLQSSPTLGSNLCLSIQKVREREILSKLFQGTGGNGWKNNDGWMDDSLDICTWYGIKCKQGSTVESILLGSNGLVGTIPTEIYEFPNLKFLWIYSNHVDMSFDGITQATSLTSLLLDSTKVRSLDGIGSGHSLVDVDVRFNNLKGSIPAELSNLVNLESFTCSENDFTGKVPELTTLRKLTTLRMSNNRLTGTLPSFAQHPSLLSLDLSQNSLTGTVPTTILNSVGESEAVFLDLSSNRLTGTVPGELARFAELTIYLRDNRISGINENLCEQSQWNQGDVGEFQCAAILCPRKTFSPKGRASEDATCSPCSENKYLGSTTCGSSSAARLSGALGLLASFAFATTGLLLWS